MKKVLGALCIMVASSSAIADHKVNHVDVEVGELSERAQFGKQSFDNNCAVCHGENGSGTDNGPPLIHDIYNPGHHNNGSISRAIAKGAPQHHWGFGDMPAQKSVGFSEVAGIIAYLRELQHQNGIHPKEHKM